MARYYRLWQKGNVMRSYTKKAIGVAVILGLVVFIFTCFNTPKYKESEVTKNAKTESFLKEIEKIESVDSLLLDRCDSILLKSTNQASTTNSISDQIDAVSTKPVKINKSVRNVRLH